MGNPSIGRGSFQPREVRQPDNTCKEVKETNITLQQHETMCFFFLFFFTTEQKSDTQHICVPFSTNSKRSEGRLITQLFLWASVCKHHSWSSLSNDRIFAGLAVEFQIETHQNSIIKTVKAGKPKQ